jgi:hypothetical protein
LYQVKTIGCSRAGVVLGVPCDLVNIETDSAYPHAK